MNWRVYHRSDAFESKMAREVLCFTIDTAVGGRESRRCKMAVAGCVRAMFELWSRLFVWVRTVMVVYKICCTSALCGLLLREALANCKTPYNGGFKVAMGCRWWRRVIREIQLQLASRRVIVESRWQMVSDCGAVSLANAIADC